MTKFRSYEEAAVFWDTHDTTDFRDSFEDVEVRTEFRKRHYELEVDDDLIKALRKQAKKPGVPVSKLASDLLPRQIPTTR
jgi:hypothetical protein